MNIIFSYIGTFKENSSIKRLMLLFGILPCLFSSNLIAQPSFFPKTEFVSSKLSGYESDKDIRKYINPAQENLVLNSTVKSDFVENSSSGVFNSTAVEGLNACVTWSLLSDSSVTSLVGDIVGQASTLGMGSSAPFMSIFYPYSNGQRLWVGTTGWIAGPRDPLRFVEFNVSPQTGNNFTVSSISFNYGDEPLTSDFNIINFQAYYSLDNWNTSFVLNTTPLIYKNTSMQSFFHGLSVLVASNQVFSLRIFPFAIQNGSPMTPTFATHNNVTICGSTLPEEPNTGSICGIKFNDHNGNGIQESGETGIANWQISTGIATIPYATTDSLGNYCFDSLPVGSYTISEINQSGWIQTAPPNPGTYTLTLSAGQQLNNVDFGNMVEPPSLGSICGVKFNDLNGNGVQDSGEPGIANWQISAGIATIPNAFTDSLGMFCFNNLSAGNYTIYEINQTGWIQTAPPAPGTYSVTLAPGQTVNNLNFGNWLDTSMACITWGLFTDSSVSSTVGNITGQVSNLGMGSSAPFMSIFYPYSSGQRLWVGTTGWIAGPRDPLRYVEFNVAPQAGNSFNVTNVSFNYGDDPLTVDFNIINFQAYYSLDNWNTSFVINTTPLIYKNTSMQTFFQGLNVAVASNQVFSLRIFPFAIQNGSPMTPTFAIHNNVTICGTTFPEVPTTGSICGIKFNDLDGNGVQDSGEPGIANWQISAGIAGIPYATADSLGNYCFDSLPVGSYTISEIAQTGWIQTAPPMPGTYTLTVSAGQQINNVDFGNMVEPPLLGSICGIKFNDLNGNGVRDFGEPGIANWQISTGIATIPNAFTDSLGMFCFNNLLAGNYTISEINQTGWIQTAPPTPGTYSVTLAPGQTINNLNFGNWLDTSMACITWGLFTDSSVTSTVGNITGQASNLGMGSSAPFMSIFYPYSNGQRLWVGTTGWLTGPRDPLRYVEFNVSPQAGNSFNVTNVSFNYGDDPLTVDFNIINFQAYYSLDNWNTSFVLNTTPLIYKNTSMQTFIQGINVPVASSQIFSLRIFPFAIQNGTPMTPTFAIHNNVTICGTTAPELPTTGSICGIKFNDLNGNGVQDSGEPGIANWQISAGIAGIPYATTDSLGNYCFDSLPVGSYTISEIAQTGWTQTAPPAPGTYSVTLAPGQTINNLNFGNWLDTSMACITWGLFTDSSVTSTVGNITGQVELIGAGSSAPFMSVFYPYSSGQRLWVGTTGWVAGPRDPLRYVEFNVSPQAGNSFTVTNVSFNYGDSPLTVDFNIINFQAYYSLDNWNTSFVLNTTPLIYKNTSMQTFIQGINVPVASSQVFSLRIFPFAIQNGSAMTPTFAIHNNVTICGTTTPEVPTTGSICGIKFNDQNGNGVQDLGEPGIANWQISAGIAGIPYATTDSLGNYCFDGLPVGSYTISEINQIGWEQTYPCMPNTYTVNVVGGETIDSISFGNKLDSAVACITWGLMTDSSVTSVVGNIFGQPENIGQGSSALFMSVFYPYNNGQRLWVGTTGWISGLLDPLRYVEFNVAPQTGNSFNVTQVSFNYGDFPLTVDFNTINFQAYYSTNGWSSSTVLNGTPLIYKNTSMLTFVKNINVPVTGSQTFSLRIFPYALQNSVPMTPTFAVHNNVTICGTTTPEVMNTGSLCGIKFEDENGNGVKDTDELGIPNWQISLNVATIPMATTDSLGKYCFNNIPLGIYTVSEVMQAGWYQTFPAAPGTYTVTLTAGQNIDSLDFGNKRDTCSTEEKVWLPLGTGTDGAILSLKSLGTDLYAGGSFTLAGGVSAGKIAKWDGLSWSNLGTGTNDEVLALAVMGGQLYAGGKFTTAGGINTNYIARWNGTTWAALGTGLDNYVTSLAVIGGNLYAGGQFTTAGGVNAKYIARWDGTNWYALGSGMNSSVSALTISGTDLFAGGLFTTAGGVTVNHIARWNGTGWYALGTGMNHNVISLAEMGGNIYAGGSFTTAGGQNANVIAKWDGVVWSALGIGMNNNVMSVVAMGGEIYAGGYYTTAGGVNAQRIAKWNGSAWVGLGLGMNSTGVLALEHKNGVLYAGGAFTTAGTINAANAARYICNDLVAVEDGVEGNFMPDHFRLEQNYPNPFNPMTTLRYDIAKVSFVTILVYDILGREVISLVNEEKNQGRYEISFDARDLSSGTYFYSIRAGDFSETKMMILMK